VDRGGRLEQVTTVGHDVCVCCRIGTAAGPPDTVVLAWRRVFAGNVRDMVLSLSRDGGRSFAEATLVHADGWRIDACPHRGGVAGLDRRGRNHLAWYTEGRRARPNVLFAMSGDGRGFSRPVRLHTAPGTIPDHVRLGVDPSRRAAAVWEDATAVRRRVLMRVLANGGHLGGPVRVLSSVTKAYAPDVTVVAEGRFLVAWNEERFPSLYTVVEPLELRDR
jgi:hypothetical protein